MGLINYFDGSFKMIEYRVCFTDNVVAVDLCYKNSNVTDKSLIFFWAFYYSKIMFNFRNDHEQQKRFLDISLLIDKNYAEGNPDIFQAIGLDKYYRYANTNGNYSLKCYGDFFYKKKGAGLNTHFPFNINTLQVVTSAVAIFQSIKDRIISDDESVMMLYATLSTLNAYYKKEINIGNTLINSVTLPKAAYDAAFDRLTYYAYMFSKTIVKKSIDTASYLYDYFHKQSIDPKEKDILINMKIAPDIAVAYINFINIFCGEWIDTGEHRSKLVGMVINNSHELLMDINLPFANSSERKSSKEDHMNYVNRQIEIYNQCQEIAIEDYNDIDARKNSLDWIIGEKIYYLIDCDANYLDVDNVKLCMNTFDLGMYELDIVGNVERLGKLIEN
ncbi:MAG TPA: hypothetical protein VIK72_12160 [Clostridiaceae bacterium]